MNAATSQPPAGGRLAPMDRGEARASDWSPDQLRAIDDICCWRDNWSYGDHPLTLGGYAGTGKTTLIAHLVNIWKGVAVGALAGKAANVLRSKGVPATTIHGLIYVPEVGDDGKTRYTKRQKLDGVETIIIDEASMVDHWIHEDLLSFGLPILYVGDHGQLEPIGRNPQLMMTPKVRLEQIHRQAADNPILRLATAFREGRDVPYWQDRQGRLKIARRNEFEQHLYSGAQIICGYNKTRHRINKSIRERNGCDSQTPEPSERIIFLKNNKTLGLFNGQQATVRKQLHGNDYAVELEVETDEGEVLCVPCLTEQFGEDPIQDHRDQNVALADFAYCVTCHKMQGSESQSVVVLEEIARGWDQKRWRYTAVTRARERLIYCA